MAKVEIDTEKVKSTGEDMKKIANEYNKLIEEMYKKIAELPNTNIWTSETDKGSAMKFTKKAMNDKEKTLDVGNNLSKIGDEIIGFADSLNNISENII